MDTDVSAATGPGPTGNGVATYARAVAAHTPTPGGGSVAAVVGALAASLTAMVGHYSSGRPVPSAPDAATARGDTAPAAGPASGAVTRTAGDPPAPGAASRSTGDGHADPFAATVAASDDLRERLLALAAADEAAYGAYIAATRLPKGTDAEKTARRAALQAALAGAAEVPLAVARAVHGLHPHLAALAAGGNPHVLSDVVVAALCAEAAGRAALVNVRVNARLLKDKERGRAYLSEADDLESTLRAWTGDVIMVANARA
ncbi:MAG: cyclodeaminase/cyclohydrolase family protein [Thermomicrobiales bacterium]